MKMDDIEELLMWVFSAHASEIYNKYLTQITPSHSSAHIPAFLPACLYTMSRCSDI